MNHSAIVSVSGGVSAGSQVCSLHSVTYSEFLGFQAVLNSWVSFAQAGVSTESSVAGFQGPDPAQCGAAST